MSAAIIKTKPSDNVIMQNWIYLFNSLCIPGILSRHCKCNTKQNIYLAAFFAPGAPAAAFLTTFLLALPNSTLRTLQNYYFHVQPILVPRSKIQRAESFLRVVQYGTDAHNHQSFAVL